jgi:serine/threonine protein phosphatase PrpC
MTISADEGTIMAVMDGHGGAECSEVLERNFHKVWDIVYLPRKRPARLFRELFEKFDRLTSRMGSGSTMSVAFIPKRKKVVHVAILGDSPVIVQQPDGTFHVSPEHNVRTNMVERLAAEKRGGYYSMNGYICYGFEGHGLQMSRAFGDYDLSKILSREPEVYTVDLGGWVLVGSDGLLSPGHDESGVQMLLDIVKMIEKQDVNAKELVDYAANDVKTGDNVTAILWRRS